MYRRTVGGLENAVKTNIQPESNETTSTVCNAYPMRIKAKRDGYFTNGDLAMRWNVSKGFIRRQQDLGNLDFIEVNQVIFVHEEDAYKFENENRHRFNVKSKRKKLRNPGAIAAAAFSMFDRDIRDRREIVKALMIPPERVDELFKLWKESSLDASYEQNKRKLHDEEFERLLKMADHPVGEKE